MKADKFWISAIAAVATAGTIGVAIAQTTQQPNGVTPATPTSDPSVNVGGQGSPQATIDKGPAASGSNGSMAQANISSGAGTTSAPADAPMAQADRG
jgi:hypothetical protein